MITESIAILAIMLCLIVVFIRAQQSDYALGVTPLYSPFCCGCFLFGPCALFRVCSSGCCCLCRYRRSCRIWCVYLFLQSAHQKKQKSEIVYCTDVWIQCGTCVHLRIPHPGPTSPARINHAQSESLTGFRFFIFLGVDKPVF